MAIWEKKRVLITVRTYPTPAFKGVEVSCTAGITEGGEWIRLFPMPYRFLAPAQKFHKYQWVDVDVTKASDFRLESYNPNVDSSQVVSKPLPPDHLWRARKAKVFPLKASGLCGLEAVRDRAGAPTLGFFKPKEILGFEMEPDDPEWSPDELARLRQFTMFEHAPKEELEKIPWKFFYRFRCEDSWCPANHRLSCTDWEIGESFRQWSREYGTGWEAAFRQRYEDQMLHKNDTHFFVGTIHGHPNRWTSWACFTRQQRPRASRRGCSNKKAHV